MLMTLLRVSTTWAAEVLLARLVSQQDLYREVKDVFLTVWEGGGEGLAPTETPLNMTVCGC